VSISLERRYKFSASHLYRRPEWDEGANRAAFGKCANLPGHGHNYRLYVTVTGEVDPLTGFLVGLPELDAVVEAQVLSVVDHQHLNSAVEEFRTEDGGPGKIPSSENLVAWIRDRLEAGLPPGVVLVKVRLEEDEDLAAEWNERQ
jgi:6-pyruvoyltetrahydropterin/6-carboxytetrahydropterin synthase